MAELLYLLTVVTGVTALVVAGLLGAMVHHGDRSDNGLALVGVAAVLAALGLFVLGRAWHGTALDGHAFAALAIAFSVAAVLAR